MPSKNIDAKWLRFTKEENALDYLEKAFFILARQKKDKKSWKWVILSLHEALYGFDNLSLRPSLDF
jgi:hypothetical protein